MAKRPLEDQMNRKSGRVKDEPLNGCMKRLKNDDRLFGDLHALAWHLNCKRVRKKLYKFLKHVKTNKKTDIEIKMEYNKCVEAVKQVITGVDGVLKVVDVGGHTDQGDRKASTESYEIGHEGQRLIKKLDSEGTFFKDIKKRSKELQKYDMDEIRTELKEFAKNMKAEKKRNRLELGSGCLEMYKTCVSNWEKNRSSAEKIRKVLVGDDRPPQKSAESSERNTEKQSMAEHSPRKQRRTSSSASLCDVKLTIENDGSKDERTVIETEKYTKAMETETSLDQDKARTKRPDDTAQDEAEERQTKRERPHLHHTVVGVHEVGNDFKALSPANESELKKIEVENLKKELEEKKSIQEFVGKLEEKKNEAKDLKKELETTSANHDRTIKELEDLKRQIEKEQKNKEGSRNRKIKELEGLVDKQKHQIETEQRKKNESERRLAEQIQETEAEQKKKEDALIRLSEMTSMQLRSNNPNIVDLSDLNRPTKIGEQLSELYDKEWTDAFEDLMKENSEREAIKTLHDIIMEAHTSCLGLSEIESMLKNIETDFLQGPIDVEVRQKLVDLRKRNALISLENVTKKLEPDILSKLSGGSSSEALIMYVDACIKISWFMAIQDPPLRLYDIQRKDFDKEKYREYTQRGMYTDFVVWPALCLHEGGPLLAKGIAQGSKVPIEDKPPTPVAPEPASTDNCAPVKAESPKEKAVHEEKQPPIKHVSSVPVQAPLISGNTMNINESKQPNSESDGMMRPKKKENPTAETVSSDKQASSKQFVSKVMVSVTSNAISSTKEDGRKLGSDDPVKNEIKSANAKETVGHRREMNASVGVGQTTEVGYPNERDTVTKL